MKKLYTVLICTLLPMCALAQQNWKAVMRYDKQNAKQALSERLSKYVTYETTADKTAGKVPSSKGQIVFGKALAKELKSIGAKNVKISKTGIVTAEIPATTTRAVPTLALLAHLDTSDALSGKDVVPQLHTKYRGEDIILHPGQNVLLTSEHSPQLSQARGHDIMTASGHTLLGADNKAGIAIIMTLADYLLGHTDIEHGTIKIAFTPDEEPATGIQTLHLPSFAADYAYLVKGAHLGETIVENFNERSFIATFNGKREGTIGTAFNSAFADNLMMASDFHTLLPRHLRPETTSGKQGFIFVHSIQTQGNQSVLKGHIRAFTKEELEELTATVRQSFDTVKAMNPKNTGMELSFADQHKNMKEILPAQLHQVLQEAMIAEEVTPRPISTRKHTDAVFLSFNGLPATTVFSGVFNTQTHLEYADIDIMEASLRTLISTATQWVRHPKP